jgi:hypothetical protein
MLKMAALAFAIVLISGCDGDDIDSDTEARWAYLGFDRAVDRAINLGFDGFNAANSANIPEQTEPGDVAGDMVINGQVDQGASDNKGMRLLVNLFDYEDGDFDDPITDDVEELRTFYNTVDGVEPALDISLRDIPDGTFSGTLIGRMVIDGAVEADADFDVAFSGDIMDAGNGDVVRVAGTLVITGTVTSGDGLFNVDVSR